MTHPLEPVGKLITLAGVVVPAVLGVMAQPALLSILAASAVLSVGYALVRAPQMARLYQESEGGKILLLPIYLLLGHCLLAAPIYGVGRIFS